MSEKKVAPPRGQQWAWRRRQLRWGPVDGKAKRRKSVFVHDGVVEEVEEPIVWCGIEVNQ